MAFDHVAVDYGGAMPKRPARVTRRLLRRASQLMRDATVLFPEMDVTAEVPEITTDQVHPRPAPEDVGARRRAWWCGGRARAPCRTLPPYEPQFDGPTLAAASPGQTESSLLRVCVLGGGSLQR
jgi:hypothetical protein